jgi:hypothetical protein
MVGAADDLPGPLVGVDEPAPGQRLVADPEAPLTGADGELVQLLGDAVVVVEGVRRDRRADEDLVGAELLHHVELALARRRLDASTSGSSASKSRNGWYRSIERPRSAHRARTRRPTTARR